MFANNGIMRITPAHDLFSLQIAKDHKLPIDHFAIDQDGNFTKYAGDFAGKNVEEFMENILQSVKNDIVIFTSKTCGKCVALKDMLLHTNVGNVKMVDNNDLPEDDLTKYNIKSLPTTVFFKDGVAEEIIIGLIPISTYLSKVNQIYGEKI